MVWNVICAYMVSKWARRYSLNYDGIIWGRIYNISLSVLIAQFKLT